MQKGQAAQRQRNQRGEGSRLRDELIAAAMRILDRTPATVLSLRIVAKEAGVAAPSVYAHFTDAKHLVNEIVRECWRQLGEEMLRATDGALDQDGRAILERQLAAYVRNAMERPSRYQLLFALQPIDIDNPHDLPSLVQPAFRMVRDTLRSMEVTGGELAQDDSFSLALHIISLVHGRIALAHLAPWRVGNEAAGIVAFVHDALDRLIPPRG